MRPYFDEDGQSLGLRHQEADSVERLAARLREAMARKGWSIGETARQASRFLSDGERLGRAHVWHYMRGRALPRAQHLKALFQIFELKTWRRVLDHPRLMTDREAPWRAYRAGEGVEMTGGLWCARSRWIGEPWRSRLQDWRGLS